MAVRKKRRDPEYVLHSYHHTDERTGNPAIVFHVRTVKEFTSFNYEILLDCSVLERTIQLRIIGLRTTPLIMPGMGPAQGRKELEHLNGAYTLVVRKPDGETNQFNLHVLPDRITMDGSPARPFILISNEPIHLPQS